MISFQPFRDWFYQCHPTKVKVHIAKEANISRGTVNKIFDDQEVKTGMIDQICKTYKLRIDQVMVFTDN